MPGISALETVSTGADVATPSDGITDAQHQKQHSTVTSEAAANVTAKLEENTIEEKSAATATSPSDDTKTSNVETVATPGDDATTTTEETGKTSSSSSSKTSVTSVASVAGGPPSASGETASHHQAPPPMALQGSGFYHQGRGLSTSYGPPPPHEYGGRPNYPPPSYSDNGFGHYPPHIRGGFPSSYNHPLHNANHHYPPTGNHHHSFHHQQQRHGGHASSYGAPPHGQQPSLSKHAPRNQHVGEEYARRHSPVARHQQQTKQDEEEEKKIDMEDNQVVTSSKGATASLSEAKAQDETENSGATNAVPPNATTGILRAARGPIVADLAADDSHPEADDVEPLPPKTLFHSSAEGKPERSPNGIMKDSSVIPGSTGSTKRERHVGFEADSKLPATSGVSSHPHHSHHSYYDHVNHHGHGRAGFSLPPPPPSYPPGPYHYHHHHHPSHSYGGGHPAGMGHGIVVDPHHPSPPPPVHSPYYAEYRPHSTGEYRPAASLRRADDETPTSMVNDQKKDQEELVSAASVVVANKGEKEETSSASSVEESTKGSDDRKERVGDANDTPMQHQQQAANPNNFDAGTSPYAPYDAYAPFGRYQPPPSGMRIGGGPGNRHYDHSPLDANPDRLKPRAESYEIDPRDPRAVAGVPAPHNPSLEPGYGHSHGHHGQNPPVTPHGYFSHYQDGPFDVRGGMDRLVATPASGGFVSSIRGR